MCQEVARCNNREGCYDSRGKRRAQRNAENNETNTMLSV